MNETQSVCPKLRFLENRLRTPMSMTSGSG